MNTCTNPGPPSWGDVIYAVLVLIAGLAITGASIGYMYRLFLHCAGVRPWRHGHGKH